MKNILRTWLLITIAFITTQCYSGYNDREDCVGYPTLINPIPDTTVSLSRDTLIIDLSGTDESVFRNTAGKTMNFNIGGTARVTHRYKRGNPDLGKEALVILEEKGTFEVSISAMDSCERLERDDFVLTVTD